MPDKNAHNTQVNNNHTDGDTKGESSPYLPKRRKGIQAKGASKPKATATKRPVKLVLDTVEYEALVVHSLRRGLNLSELVGELIRKNLTEWSIHARPSQRGD
jgi:hypothetical protein